MTPARVAARGVTNVIVGGVLLHLTLGTLYLWGCIQPYVTSYVRLFHPSVTTSDTTTIYGCGVLGNALAMPLVGLLQFTLGLRGCAAFGSALVSLAMLLCSLATSVGGLAVLNTVFGVGIAFAYTCPLVCGYGWMPDRKGTVSGFIVAGFGAGAAVFTGVATGWVNPDNASPNPATGFYSREIAARVPGMYLILGSCYLVLGMLGSWMLSPPPLSSGSTPGSSDAPVAMHKTRRRLIISRSLSSTGDYASLDSDEQSPSSPDGELVASRFDNLDTRISRPDGTPGTAIGDDDIGLEYMRGDAVKEEGNSPATEAPSNRGKHGTSSSSMNNIVNSPFVIGEDEPGSVGASEHLLRKLPDHALMSVDLSRDIAIDNGDGVAIGEESIQGVDEGLLVRREDETRPELFAWKLLTRWDYFHVSLSFALTAVSGLFIAGNYKDIAQQRFPNDDRFLSIMGSFASLFNALGRVLAGLAIDRFGCFATLVVVAVLTMCLLLIYNGAGQDSKPACFVVICLLHMLYGSNFAIYPTLTAELFGVSSAGPNYGLVFMAYGAISFLVMLFLARINGSHQVFLVCAGISFAGAVCVSLHWGRWRRAKSRSPGV